MIRRVIFLLAALFLGAGGDAFAQSGQPFSGGCPSPAITIGTTTFNCGGTSATLSGLTLVGITGATTTGPDVEVSITGDTNARVALGVNVTDVARVSFGPGNAVRDLFLERAGAANLRHGAPDAASPAAQTISVQNVVAGTSNTAGAALTIKGSQGTGTGAGGSIILQTAPAGGSGTGQNALAAALTLTSAGNATLVGVLGTGAGTVGAPALTIGGDTTSGWYRNAANQWTWTGSGVTGTISFISSVIRIASDVPFGWSSTSSTTAADVLLNRDAAGILAQRNANNGQILRVGYNFTDASNYSWAMIDAGQTTANTVGIGSRSVGSPGQKLTKLGVFVDGTNQLDYAITTAARWTSAVGFSATAFFVGATAGVSCSAGALNPVTTVVTNGIITTC